MLRSNTFILVFLQGKFTQVEMKQAGDRGTKKHIYICILDWII